MKKLLLIATFVITTFTGSMVPAQAAQAVTGSDFQPGRIMDDAVFYDKTAMSVSEIQQFLNSKVPTCDRWGTQAYAGTTRRAYSEARGIEFPLTCLKSYYENTSNHKNNLAGKPKPDGAKSAAKIIWDVAQRYTINPQVLIVLLQKEQSLISDDWPWPIQYRSATGYGCPDSAPCNSEYYGFYNQVEKAAWQFRRYATTPNNYNFVPNENNFIQWNPNSSCGGSTVFIKNQATASLYNYTPYRPNQAALNNLYGAGNSCSSYGNRNFWRMFNDWFGSTLSPDYSAQVLSTRTYTSSSLAITESSERMHTSERIYVDMRIRNTGNTAWTRASTRLAISDNKAGKFRDHTWLSSNRITAMREGTVDPQEVATFRFWYKAPSKTGSYKEHFRVAIVGGGFTKNGQRTIGTQVVTPQYVAERTDVGAYTGSDKATPTTSRIMQKGDRVYVVLKYKNKGNVTWTKSKMRLAATHLHNLPAKFYDPSWLSNDRIAEMNETLVAPNQTATFEFWYKAPNSTGTKRQFFGLLLKDMSWISSGDRYLTTNVTD